jgi:molybdopterin converting factor small subunit
MGGDEAALDSTGAEGHGGTVVARLFAGLEERTRDGRAEQPVPLARAATVAALLEALGLAAGAAGLVLVNGVHGGADTVLHDGDEVALFPPVGGG